MIKDFLNCTIALFFSMNSVVSASETNSSSGNDLKIVTSRKQDPNSNLSVICRVTIGERITEFDLLIKTGERGRLIKRSYGHLTEVELDSDQYSYLERFVTQLKGLKSHDIKNCENKNVQLIFGDLSKLKVTACIDSQTRVTNLIMSFANTLEGFSKFKK